MTVIAAVHQHGETWIGCDSLITEGGLRFAGHSKLIHGKDMVIGWAGAYRTFGLLKANIDKIAEARSPWEIATAIRTVLKDDGYSPQSGSGAPDYGTGIIVATPAEVIDLTGDFSVYSAIDGEVIARGSGAQIALGAAFPLRWETPKARITAAVEAACHYDTSCGGMTHICAVEYAVSLRAAAQ